ncbi:MAG: MFS transporter [Oscillatoriales cyanobacterium SM2_2_1]|nr:MFS transporter [Oscillatoriales cyanobacterium SM2_2_1]
MQTPEPKTVNAFWALLQNSAFVALWSAQILSQLADKILLTLVVGLAATPNFLTDRWITGDWRDSLVMVAFTTPAILFGTLAGIYVDQHSKRQTLVVCNFIQGSLLLAIAFLPPSFLFLLLVTFAVSTLAQAFAPAELAILPLIVPKSLLISANALFTVTIMGALIVGFAIGSPLLRWIAEILPQAPILARVGTVGGMYFLANAALAAVPDHEKLKSRELNMGGIWHNLQEGLRYVRGDRPVRGAMLQLVLLYAVLASMIRLSTNLTELLGQNREDFGFFLAATGVGLTLGAFILSQLGDRLSHLPLSLIGFNGIAITLILFALITELWVGLGICMFLGLHGALIVVPMMSLIQHHTPETMRGKVFGLLNNAQNIALSVSVVMVGLLLQIATSLMGERLGFQVVLILCSSLVAGFGMWAWRLSREEEAP